MDHLLNLDEEFDLADSAAPALEVEARADMRALSEMVADAGRDLADLLDHAEIERAAPNERLNRVEESPAERKIAGSSAGADESGAFPGQSTRFIVRNRRVHRKCDRRDFRRWPQAKIDAFNVTVLGTLLEEFDDAAADAHRRFARIVAAAPRQCLGLEQQQQVDVRGIIELVTAQLAHGDDRETSRLRIGHPLADRGADGPVDGAVREVGQQSGSLARAKARPRGLRAQRPVRALGAAAAVSPKGRPPAFATRA